MKKILGLDLGTNSIGWAVVNEAETIDEETKLTNIESAGSRIIPMDAGTDYTGFHNARLRLEKKNAGKFTLSWCEDKKYFMITRNE